MDHPAPSRRRRRPPARRFDRLRAPSLPRGWRCLGWEHSGRHNRSGSARPDGSGDGLNRSRTRSPHARKNRAKAGWGGESRSNADTSRIWHRQLNAIMPPARDGQYVRIGCSAGRRPMRAEASRSPSPFRYDRSVPFVAFGGGSVRRHELGGDIHAVGVEVGAVSQRGDHGALR